MTVRHFSLYVKICITWVGPAQSRKRNPLQVWNIVIRIVFTHQLSPRLIKKRDLCVAEPTNVYSIACYTAQMHIL